MAAAGVSPRQLRIPLSKRSSATSQPFLGVSAPSCPYRTGSPAQSAIRRRSRGRPSGCCRRTRARSSCLPCTAPRHRRSA